jgi:ketosteroid isomerase-like protein
MEFAMRLAEVFNSRDLDTLFDLSTADLEWAPAMGAVEGEVFRGREGIETYWGRLDEAWEDYHVVANEYRDLGDRVLMLGRMVGRGRGSGVLVDTPLGVMVNFRADMIAGIRGYLDHGEALRAAGLSE